MIGGEGVGSRGLTGHPAPAALAREGLLAARAQPVATFTAALVVAVVCVAVLLTTGRTAATENAVIASIDGVGTRLVVAADGSGKAQISARSVRAVESLGGVTWAFGLGAASEVRNTDLPTMQGVTQRDVVGTLPPELSLITGRLAAVDGEALVGTRAAAALRLADSVGSVGTEASRVGVVGTFDALGPLDTLDDSVLVRRTDTMAGPLRVLYVLVDDATHAEQTARAVAAALVAEKPADVVVETSAGVIALRDVVAGTLGSSSRQLMAGLLGASLLLVTVTMFGAVSGRKRDFGRRRALGATRSSLVVLVLVQSAVAAILGASVGALGGVALVHATAGAVPAWQFTAGVAALAVLVALVGSVPPALTAASRDPVRVLRVP